MMKACETVALQLQWSLSAALDGGKWSASRPGRFISRQSSPCTLEYKGWLERTVGRKMLWIWDTYQLPLPGIEPRFLGRHIRSLLSTLTELFLVAVQFYITIDKTSIKE
jgi:hypothetical protein